MKFLLDTHIWIWRLLEPERLSLPARRAFATAQARFHLSPISIWETLVLVRKGRLELSPDAPSWIRESLRLSGLTMVPLDYEIALRSEALEGFASRDPADRFLVATALEKELILISADGPMNQWSGIDTLW